MNFPFIFLSCYIDNYFYDAKKLLDENESRPKKNTIAEDIQETL